MRILIADDDPGARLLLEHAVKRWGGYEVVAVDDGITAWNCLCSSDPPLLALLDWMMPGMDGVDICRRVRSRSDSRGIYLILITGNESRESRLTGLQAGANDYLTKPFDPAELQARVHVASHVVRLQLQLQGRVHELEEALTRVKRLERLLPICMYCKKIRDEQDSWQQIESYISSHSDAEFSHGICADCYESICEPQLKQIEKALSGGST